MKKLLAVLAVCCATLLAGCGGAANDGADAATPASSDSGMVAPESAELSDGDEAKAYDSAGRTDADPPARQSALVNTGHVSLSADDVQKARLQAQSVADRHGGEVTESETSSDEDGKASYARLVLRVPAKSYADALADLEEIGTLRDSSSSTEDVTTQVIDVEARVKVQRASIERIRTLLSAAKDIGDIVRIESELSRREAELDSLLGQQAHLADQTSRSTISVDISRTDEDEPEEDRDGFLGGLERGWDALVAFTSGALLVLGAVIPWLPLVAVVLAAGWWVVRRVSLRRARSAE